MFAIKEHVGVGGGHNPGGEREMVQQVQIRDPSLLSEQGNPLIAYLSVANPDPTLEKNANPDP